MSKKSNKTIFWCSSCLNMSTRPRIEFDERGRCNACVWSEKKKQIDWDSKLVEFSKIINEIKNPDSEYDCLVPCSGGKDGSYVAYTLKHKHNLNPLAVTVRPPLSLELGDKNLINFINSGYEHIHVTPNPTIMRNINKYGFIEKGFPYYGWLIAIFTAVIDIATKFNIPLIVYGEDGEVEYGGSTETVDEPLFDLNYMKRVYFEAGHEKVLKIVKNKFGYDDRDLRMWLFPSDNQIKKANLSFTHWSYFEPWDSYKNYVVAKEHCGLEEQVDLNIGTFTNFAQNDQALYSLHAYMMYLKFGFGRATQDAGIEIRRGSMDRDQAINLVKLYDNHYPHQHIEQYLKYYDMTKDEFDDVLDSFANKDLFEKKDGTWEPKFDVGSEFFL